MTKTLNRQSFVIILLVFTCFLIHAEIDSEYEVDVGGFFTVSVCEPTHCNNICLLTGAEL